MRRWRRGGVVLVVLVAAWWLWPRAAPPVGVEAAVVAKPAARIAAERAALPLPPREETLVPLGYVGEVTTDPSERTVRCALPAEHVGATEASVEGLPWKGRVLLAVRDGAFEVPLPPVDPRPGHPLALVRTWGGGPAWEAAGREVHALDAADVHAVTVEIPGVGRTTALLQLGEGGWSCAVDPPEPYVFVTGTVRGPGAADAWVDGCGAYAEVDDDGGYAIELPAGVCTLWAHRRDGAFQLPSDPADLDTEPGDELVVDFALPRWRAGGVGIALDPGDDGVGVLTVFPDTPAADAGLQQGDLIVAVDGIDVVGRSLDDYMATALGPEGTEVVYTIVRDDEELDVVMAREALEQEGAVAVRPR